MPSATEQLVTYLTDAHSIEEQALAQLRTAPDIAGDPQLAGLFADHLRETEQHERLVRGRRRPPAPPRGTPHRRGPPPRGPPDPRRPPPPNPKDTIMAAGGKGFVL